MHILGLDARPIPPNRFRNFPRASSTCSGRHFGPGCAAPLLSFRHPSNAIPRRTVFTPDDRLLATRFSGSDVFVWEIDSGNLLLTTRCERAVGRAFNVMVVQP
jgi:hypothetical protein